jgi:hypothetical protein
MQAWVHYVPIQVDYSDLYDAIAFVSRPAPSPSRFSLTHLAGSPADHCSSGVTSPAKAVSPHRQKRSQTQAERGRTRTGDGPT